MKRLICTICSHKSQDIVNRLRSSQTYEHYSVPTEKLKRSFIPFSANDYQYILSGVLAIIAFYPTFPVAYLLHRIVLYSVCMYRIVAIQPFGCNSATLQYSSFNIIHLSVTMSSTYLMSGARQRIGSSCS